MACENVGSTNSDVAGLGIIVSFVIQGVLSVAFSIWAFKIVLGLDVSDGENMRSALCKMLPRAQTAKQQATGQKHNNPTAPPYDEGTKKKLITDLLCTISDAQTINGISLLVSAIVQRDTLGLYHLRIIYDTVNFTGVSQCAARFIVSQSSRASMFRYMLTCLFYSLYLTFITIFAIRLHSWDDASGVCYHTNSTSSNHPLEDEVYLGITTSFLLFSMVCSCREPFDDFVRRLNEHIPESKHKHLFINAISMVLTLKSPESKLSQDQRSQHVSTGPSLEETRCHDSGELSWIKSWVKLCITGFQKGATIQDFATNDPLFILFLTMYPCPVHGYFVFAIRYSNQAYLIGESEDQWGFGQIVPLVVLMSVIFDCLGVLFRCSTRARNSGIGKYFSFMMAEDEVNVCERCVGRSSAETGQDGDLESGNDSSPRALE